MSITLRTSTTWLTRGREMLSRSATLLRLAGEMGRSRRYVPPFETEIQALGHKGLGVGRAPDGREVLVRGAPPGSRVSVQVFKRKKSTLHARRTHMVRPPRAHAQPQCDAFGLCGGCTLQELKLDAQRRHKTEMAWQDVLAGRPSDATLHATRGAPAAYGYRNKIELSFGTRRYLSEVQHQRGEPIQGRFLGFHAPGRFDRVVDAPRCELVHDDINRLLATTRRLTLHADAPEPYDVRSHEGFWRHLGVRRGERTGEILLTLFTATGTPEDHAAVASLAEALRAEPLQDHELVGVIWKINDGVADVARGEVGAVWGRDHLFERLGEVTYRLSSKAFFQTTTQGAEILYDTIGEAIGRGGTLLDLYCGTGAIGLYLADRFDHVVGVEEVDQAVLDARENAARNCIEATYHTGRVEHALEVLSSTEGRRHLVVDPPRVGLHPKVAKALAGADAEGLVYVACKPSSLGRDRATLEEGGWHMTDVWVVDLFPQTGHVEVVARFERIPQATDVPAADTTS